MNAYRMVEDLRDNCGEATAAHWDNAELLRKLNTAQRRIATLIQLQAGDWLVKSASLTPVASVITLPSDCAKPVYLEETSSGRAISLDANLRDRRVTRPEGTSLYSGFLEAYLLKGTLEINMSSYVQACTLWYQQRVADLHMGTADAGGAASLTFQSANQPRLEADHYNNVGIEIVEGTAVGSDTITDYAITAAQTSVKGVCTVTGTYASDSVYGTVSILPEEAHALIVLKATTLCLAKPSSAIDPKYYQFFKQEYREAEKDFKEWISTRLSGSMRTRITEVE